MISQRDLGTTKEEQKQRIRALVRAGEGILAGNRNLKIYGRLDCSCGKRMNPENRVFFNDQEQALQEGYRPCGRCMRGEYRRWKDKGH